MQQLLSGFIQCVLASPFSNSYCVTTLSRWKIISKQTKSNKPFLRNRKLGKRNLSMSVVAFTASGGLQVLRNSSRYSTYQIFLLVRTSFCIKTSFNVPRLEQPLAERDARHRGVPLFRSLWGGVGGQEKTGGFFCFHL